MTPHLGKSYLLADKWFVHVRMDIMDKNQNLVGFYKCLVSPVFSSNNVCCEEFPTFTQVYI